MAAGAGTAKPLQTVTLERHLGKPLLTAREYRNHLLKRYMSLQEAWEELDTNADGEIDFREFVKGSRKTGFRGNLRQIFIELTRRVPNARLRMSDLEPNLKRTEERLRMEKQQALDQRLEERKKQRTKGILAQPSALRNAHAPKTHGEVELFLRENLGHPLETRVPCEAADFRKHLQNRYSGLPRAWGFLDVNENGVLEFAEFVQACRRVGFSGNLRKIFTELCGDGGQFLRPSDLDPTGSKGLSVPRLRDKEAAFDQRRLENEEVLLDFRKRTKERVRHDPDLHFAKGLPLPLPSGLRPPLIRTGLASPPGSGAILGAENTGKPLGHVSGVQSEVVVALPPLHSACTFLNLQGGRYRRSEGRPPSVMGPGR